MNKILLIKLEQPSYIELGFLRVSYAGSINMILELNYTVLMLDQL